MPAGESETARAQRQIEELQRKIGQQQLDLDFFSRSLAAGQGATPEEGRAWRDGIYAVIHAQMQQQGARDGIERRCQLAQVSRAGYYRHWQASKPRQEETGLRDEIQRLALANRHYGYRRITALLQRSGWVVNRKRVLRIAREDNLLCVPKRAFRPATTDSGHGWRTWPNLARRLVPMAVNQLWARLAKVPTAKPLE